MHIQKPHLLALVLVSSAWAYPLGQINQGQESAPQVKSPPSSGKIDPILHKKRDVPIAGMPAGASLNSLRGLIKRADAPENPTEDEALKKTNNDKKDEAEKPGNPTEKTDGASPTEGATRKTGNPTEKTNEKTTEDPQLPKSQTNGITTPGNKLLAPVPTNPTVKPEDEKPKKEEKKASPPPAGQPITLDVPKIKDRLAEHRKTFDEFTSKVRNHVDEKLEKIAEGQKKGGEPTPIPIKPTTEVKIPPPENSDKTSKKEDPKTSEEPAPPVNSMAM
ncbi:hypothetical protein PTTG_28376 [Puccinia triticina 1-1 BBBD Race 1]|uniref:Secreted protein n=2 Tax=Puccinia triticina TaxID=208348 RepID=A0A180GD31_PUCT1|nr:uncharacterized protein PtA15_6A870 [Puccinia triticina]OAV90252.1 hypothetical protein PTTG_28376 [Puccinia triticina 1-1 BBBD Race 1]WAQ86238.1 hypothetical protein PtA15_6A870 [Puccinia triticina]